MRRPAALLAAAATISCQSMSLYEGDRDPFARMIDVIEPIDISPSDRQPALRPPGNVAALPPSPPSVPAMPGAAPPDAACPAPNAAGAERASPAPTLALDAPDPPAPAAPVAASSVPPAPPAAIPAPPAAVADPGAEPGGVGASEPSSRSDGTPASSRPRRVCAEAAPPVPAPSANEEPPAVATTPPATPPAQPSQAPEPAPTPAEDPLPLASDERTAAPAAPAPMPAPSVPAPPPASPRAEPKPATATLIDESATPEPPPTAPEASSRPVPATLEPAAQPTARDRGRPLIQRSNKVNSASASGATFASADGQTGVAFGAQIGGAARPIGVRSPDTTRQIIGSAKGTLAECYVNEQLFTAEAKGRRS